VDVGELVRNIASAKGMKKPARVRVSECFVLVWIIKWWRRGESKSTAINMITKKNFMLIF